MLHDFAAISRTIIEFISILIIMCGVVVAIFRGCRLFLPCARAAACRATPGSSCGSLSKIR